MPQLPPALAPNALIGVVSPSSPTVRPSDFLRLEHWAARHGFRVRLFDHAQDRWTYLAGSDEARAADVTAAFADPEVDMVLTMRGGSGGWRMASLVDRDVVRANPKLFFGYSDTTALHLVLGKDADLVTFYGPAASSLIGRSPSPYTTRHFLHAISSSEPLGEIERDPDDPFTFAITGGVAEGPLRGGCLTLLAAAMGTPWQPDWRGAIVFFEDVGEEPYKLDNYLTQLRLAGAWEGVAGVVVGEHVDCGPREVRPGYPYGTFHAEEVFRQHLEPLGVPVMVGLPCGHGRHIASLPLGVNARLDADACTLTLVDAATTPARER